MDEIRNYNLFPVEQKERVFFLDFAKVVAAFLVVFGHLYSAESSERVYIYAFHMPFFFFVSGLFHKWRGKINWGKYCNRLFVPLFIFNLLYILLGGVFYAYDIWTWAPSEFGIYEDVVTNVKAMMKCFIRGLFFIKNLPNSVTWFLLVLLYCKVIVDVISKYNINKTIVLGGLLIMNLFALKYGMSIPFWIGNVAMALPFYYIAFVYNKKIMGWLRETYKNKIIVIFIISLLISICLSKINGKVSIFTVNFGGMQIPVNILIFYLNAFAGIIMLLSICSLFDKPNRIIKEMGNALMAILVLQQFFLTSIRSVYGFEIPNYGLAILFSIAIMIISTVLSKLYYNVKLRK